MEHLPAHLHKSLSRERSVPPRHRAQIWALMTGGEVEAAELAEVEEALARVDTESAPNRRVISQDVERTRPHQLSAEHQAWMRKVVGSGRRVSLDRFFDLLTGSARGVGGCAWVAQGAHAVLHRGRRRLHARAERGPRTVHSARRASAA